MAKLFIAVNKINRRSIVQFRQKLNGAGCFILTLTLCLFTAHTSYADTLTNKLDSLLATPPITSVQLAPYQAVYSSTFNGISADMTQTLSQANNSRWQLENTLSFMFVGFSEKAQFSIRESQVLPATYDYKNKISSKRNSSLSFNRINHSVADSAHGNQPFTIPEGALDKLSLIAQMRLDFIYQQGDLTEKTYHIVDRTKYKTYQVKRLDEEVLNTPLGELNTVKIEQRRPGKEKHTIIWLAKDLNYFVVKIERIKDGEIKFAINLKSFTINK